MKDCLRIVVVGEIDAGKSSLIGRFLFEMGSIPEDTIDEIKDYSLTRKGAFEFAHLLDSLEEERNNNQTIDTTQVFCKDKKGEGFVFIDVPGHQELLKNALCGSSYADAAILVIDIRKSIEEGAKRHISILKFLGIEKIIVALNKMDLLDFDYKLFKDTQNKVVEFFKAAGLDYEYIIPVSAACADNLVKNSQRLPWYKGLTLIEALEKIEKYSNQDKNEGFYFSIQDTYQIGKDKFFVGMVLSGDIRKGQIVRIAPSDKESRIKTIRVFNGTKDFATKGQSIGLALINPGDFTRGQIIYKGAPPEVVTQIKAKIFCVDKLNVSGAFTIKCLSQKMQARIKKINKVMTKSTSEFDSKINTLNQAEVAEIVISLESPIVINNYRRQEKMGRFVLEDNGVICAAGIIS